MCKASNGIETTYVCKNDIGLKQITVLLLARSELYWPSSAGISREATVPYQSEDYAKYEMHYIKRIESSLCNEMYI